MAGETQHTYAVKKLDAEFKLQDEGTALEQYSSSEKATKESSEHFSSSDVEERTFSRGAKFVDKDRDYTQQREAVIRPQQAGKIDFKSLQNKPKFASNRTWPSGKGSPQSPSGKNRSRDKGKRSGKSERGNPQQLYRLSIINPRSNPTIGIAYPQQKVSPPKKLEASRGPVSGSYRFHVPSIPEREAELQQEEINYSRCFQETSSNLTSPSYTSQALGTTGGTSTHQQPPQQQQQPGPMENNNNTQPSGHLLFPDFQLSGSNDWSPERTFNGSNYGISSQKSTVLSEVNKANGSCLPFQYGYLLLEDSNPDPFPCDQNPQSQDYIDSSLTAAQVTLNSFTFQTSGEGQEGVQNNTQFNSDQRQDRSSYPHPPQPPQYLQSPQGAASSMHCTRGLSEDSASSESSGSISQQSDQASTSPVNLSEDSQISKTGHPPPFYHQHQLKAQGPTDHLSTNSHHFHSDASRNLPYAPEREKHDMMSYLQNKEHQKPSMEGNKGYMEGFGVEHHPPPPPYSAHQLLSTSLATANLDQLDVLLTCKQCDQNFTNLASFLGHKQCPTDLHLSLLGLNKNGELMSDSETKGDSKDDPMKLNLFTGAVPNPTFGEYDYVSDSDDESEPVKIASQGRLSQSSRCKYTYTKECKWRARSDRDSAAWRHESKECFDVKKAEDVSLSLEKPGSHQRLRRRGSRSSTSSEVSTSVSISSDGINSPKSTDRTDSDYKIIDYSTNLNSCVSEDELEIKRIVTELENQLQTAKLSPPLLTEESPKQLKMSRFSPLRLDDESENEDTGLDMGCPVQSMALAVSIMPSDPHSESFAEHSLPWSSPFEFELMEGQHTPTHDEPIVLEQFSKKDDREHSMTTTTSNTEKVKEQLKQEDHKDEDMDVDKRTDIEKSEEILESKTYAENLMKSLEVISDSIFKNDPITPEEEEPNLTSPNVDEEEPAIKQSPKDDCQPCDRSDDTTLTSDKRLCDIETEVPMSPDHTAKLSPPDESLNKSNIQNYIKCPSILLGLPSQSTAPSTGDLDICPAPLQTIDYLDLHVDLLKRVDPEALDIYKVPSELNTLAFIKDISDNQHTPKPLIICENEPTPLPSDQTQSLTVEEGQCSVTYQQEEETTQKKIHLCEICSMCFRTVPGLKRHKAMKHLIRTERSPHLENANHQGSLHSYQTSQSIETEHKDDLELLVPQTCLQTESNEVSENHCPETSNSSFVTKQGETNFILENITSETNMAVPADDIVQQMPPQFTKVKKIYKPRKNRNKEVNVKPDPFSDELLNILKTDILQAIAPEFQTQVKQGCGKSPEKQDIINYLVNHKVKEQEEVPFTVTSNSGIEQIPMSPIELTDLAMDLTQSNNDTEEVKSTNLPEIINGVAEVSMEVSVSKDISRGYDMSRENLHDTKEACEQQTKDESNAKEKLGEVAVKIECEKNSGPTDEVDNLSCFKSSLTSPPRLSADLNAFLDDESTFSQLFPTRNEELKRKKFAKVYGKKNKKQKLSTDSPLVQDYPPPDLYLEKKDDYTENQIDQTFVNNQNDPCEYETISIDDAIMLNMCHNSTLKSDSKKVCSMKGDTTDHKDNHENDVDHGSDFLCQPESTIDKASLAWNASNDSVTDTGISSDPTSCKAEAPNPPCPLPIIASSAPYPGESCATDNVSPFHSIDIPNLNTTFQLPEMQLFDSNKDISLVRPIGTDYAETRDTAKAKKLTERRGRKRQEGSVKIKDKQYKCKVCFTWFLTLGELNFHKLSHNPSPPPTCYMCVQRKFSSREQLRDHLREKHAKNKAGFWTCGMCLKEISDVWMYNEHLREHATQFARKGQSHSAILGSLPGSGMQESAVKNFITSIMQRRPSKASRESSKVSNKEKLAVVENTEQEVKTTEVAQPKVVKPKGNSEKVGKPSTLTPVEVLHNTEPVPKNVEMHPNCKDPSRDCHHCGKQFPKPFKLQRHLVVHNLNKIFLCHKCPVTYQEPQDLKYHLKNEHEEVDELDSRHTTLYTCELCADVMHVIKKSFICSTCNYTFSKKEQFDRHMEKHLSGGNKIFKFRGVLRPIKTSPSKENDECELPANKKRRILTDSLQENSSDSGIASIASLHLNKSAEMPVLKLSVHTTEDSTQTSAGEYHTENYASVKTEDMAEDYSDMLVELEHCTFHLGSEGLSTATPKTEDIDPSPSPKLPVRDISEADGKSFTEPCDVKEEHDPLESSIAEKERECFANDKQSTPESSIQTTTAEAEKKKIQRRDSTASDEELYVSFRENLINSSMTPDTHDIHRPPTKHKSSTIVMDQMREGELGQQTTSPHSHDNKQNDKTSTPKPSENTKHSSNNSPRAMESTPVHHTKITSQGPPSNEDKDSVRREQKKRKEMRTPHSLQRVSSSATRENLAADIKTKNRFRLSKCESPAVHRKSDGSSEYPVLSSVKEDVVSNKIVSKHKTSGSLGLQAKRSSLDNCTPRKAEMVHHINGDYKAKKGPLGRPLHYPVSKASALPMNNSLNKSRPKTGVRSMESHSYRTAESQNNLLSQLFGQKLTSFKIPLRKDTSEPIN
ncbi:uncharacterized protein LOC120053273 [Salvelinus namaycush]|uniref:Uncharacterized protein LOC120053273 n=1 Tax=Salvelinus namaycush TaxID=8040 RepID=A0A8U1BNH6_SALNM|nr:uncharacterized protein LOC120053273 [Salvelinus namaycush]